MINKTKLCHEAFQKKILNFYIHIYEKGRENREKREGLCICEGEEGVG